jgi:hypothetical protein
MYVTIKTKQSPWYNKISISHLTIKQAWKNATNNLFDGRINLETHIGVSAFSKRNHEHHMDLPLVF